MNEKNKAREQSLALNNWIDMGKRATVVACTGWGKTKLGVDIINLLSSQTEDVLKVRIVVPTTNLRDQEWQNELKTWSSISTMKKASIEVECQQSVYSLENKGEVDLLIVDEVHEALSPQYRKVFETDYKYLLCLTATLPANKDDYMTFLDSVAPVCYYISVKEAKDKGIISDFVIYNIPVAMNSKERWLYTKFNSMFLEGKSEIEALAKTHRKFYTSSNAFDLANKYVRKKKDRNLASHELSMIEASNKFWSGMSMRRKTLNTTESKISTAAELIYKEDSINKWIVFSLYTSQADAIYDKLTSMGIPCVKYHTKMSKKEKDEHFNRILKGDFKVICSAEALQTGFNLPELDGAIALSFNSDKISMTQSLGRAVRFVKNKQAKYFNLYNKNTQEEKWLDKRLDGIKYINLSSLWDYFNNKT